jgi:hypothetical protein
MISASFGLVDSLSNHKLQPNARSTDNRPYSHRLDLMGGGLVLRDLLFMPSADNRSA